MSQLLDSMESEWRAQLRSMREAIAELKLDQRNGETKGYGHDIDLDGGDITGGSGSEDIWDVWSDEGETAESSDMWDDFDEGLPATNDVQIHYNWRWLQLMCDSLAKGRSGLDAGQLVESISTILESDMPG